MPNLALAFDILANDRQASRTLDHFAGHAERTSRKVGGTFGRLGKSLVGAVAGFATISVFKGFIEDAEESRKVARLTAQVIKTTGGAAHISARQVGELATAVSNKTGIDDEAIQSGQNLLLTFTNVRNEVGKGSKIFDRATGIITDMSVALGQDTKASAIQLGKALNDPIRGVTALRRVGVSFTAQQQKQIKTLVEHGKTLEAQKLILDELGKEFGGAAEAAATPTAKLRVAAGNLAEDIGGLLLPAVDKTATFMNTKGVPAIEDFIHGFQTGTGPGGQFADVIHEIGDKAQGAWNIAKPFFSYIGDHPKLFAEIGKDAVIFAGAMKALGTVKKLPGLGSLLGGGKGGVLGGVTKAAPLPVFVTNPGFGGGVVPDVPGSKTPKVDPGRAAKVAGAARLAGGFAASAVVGHEIGTAIAVEINKRGDRNLTDLQKTVRELILAQAKTVRPVDANGKVNPGRAAEIRAADLAFPSAHQVDMTAAYDFLVKYGDKTTEVRKLLGQLAKDPTVARALKERAAQFARNEAVLTGGLSRTKEYAETAGKAITTSLGPRLSAAAIKSRDRLNDLRDAARGVPKDIKPKIQLVGAETTNGWIDHLYGGLVKVDKKHPRPTIALAGAQRSEAEAARVEAALGRLNGQHVKAYIDVKTLITRGVINRHEREGGARARGGSMYPGKVYTINERGLERFEPSVVGRMVPAAQTAATTGGSTNYYLTVNEAGHTPREFLPRVMEKAVYLHGA